MMLDYKWTIDYQYESFILILVYFTITDMELFTEYR